MELHGTVFENDELIIASILRTESNICYLKSNSPWYLHQARVQLECEFYANIPFFVDLSWMILFNVFPFSP